MDKYAMKFIVIITSITVNTQVAGDKILHSSSISNSPIKFNWLNFIPYKNRVLKSSNKEELSTDSIKTCLAACVSKTYCRSVNMIKLNDTFYTCETLQEDKFELNCDFAWDENSVHYAIQSPCTFNSSICEDPKTKCVPDYITESYSCVNKDVILSNDFCPTIDIATGFINLNAIGNLCGHCGSGEGASDEGWLAILGSGGRSFFNFNRSWEEYKQGFSFINTTDQAYYIGNEKLYELTKTPTRLYIRMYGYLKNGNGNPVLQEFEYGLFSIGSEKENYKLQISDPKTMIDTPEAHSFMNYHDGCTFSTYDHGEKQGEANKFGVGWWFGNEIGALFFPSEKIFPNNFKYLKYLEDEPVEIVELFIRRY